MLGGPLVYFIISYQMSSTVGVLKYFGRNSLFIGSFVWQRIPLDFLQGDKFREAADNYIRPLLTKVYKISLHITLCLV